MKRSLLIAHFSWLNIFTLFPCCNLTLLFSLLLQVLLLLAWGFICCKVNSFFPKTCCTYNFKIWSDNCPRYGLLIWGKLLFFHDCWVSIMFNCSSYGNYRLDGIQSWGWARICKIYFCMRRFYIIILFSLWLVECLWLTVICGSPF